MFCESCGNPLPDDAKFCTVCGRRPTMPRKAGLSRLYSTAYTAACHAVRTAPMAASSAPMSVGQFIGMFLLLCIRS
jgi:uncharacterized membrane protein YvbJ